MLVASLLVGAGGAFMAMNATAIGTVDRGEQEVEEMEDFDAPLDDDWGDEGWGDEEGDDWAEEAEGAEEGAEAVEEATE